MVKRAQLPRSLFIASSWPWLVTSFVFARGRHGVVHEPISVELNPDNPRRRGDYQRRSRFQDVDLLHQASLHRHQIRRDWLLARIWGWIYYLAFSRCMRQCNVDWFPGIVSIFVTAFTNLGLGPDLVGTGICSFYIHRVPKKHVTTFSTITLTISVRLQ